MKESTYDKKDLASEKEVLVGERITQIAEKIAATLKDSIDVQQLSTSHDYLNYLQNNVIKKTLIQYAMGEDFIVQAYFQIDPQVTPQLNPEELLAGTVIENKGNWDIICEHDLSYVKDCHPENDFMKWWYFECIRKGKGGWTRVYFDPYINIDVVTYSLPVYIKGKLIGVVGIDLDYADFRKVMNKRLLDSIGGEIEIFHKEREGIGEESAWSDEYINLDTMSILSKNDVFEGVVTRSKEMGDVMELAIRASISDANVLLLGETGVGKDFIAQYIHSKSTVQNGPFINVNCSAIPENLLESEFFGYAKGAFTGAKNEGSVGFFEAAKGGTIFLNEIGELPLHMQAKFLDVIQTKSITRIGENVKRATNFRLIAATNRNLKELVALGTFREDLYYRLYVIPIFIPPLRERKEDIVTLLNYNLSKNIEKYHQTRKYSPALVNLLKNYSWPGNIRELENLVERLFFTSSQTVIGIECLPADFLKNEEENREQFISRNSTLKDMLNDYEASIIKQFYKELGSSYKVATALGISQSQANSKIKKYVRSSSG